MSRRTSEASKAIRLAWQKEQDLVKEGKGTRQWNVQQQKDIIELGKAYDEDARAFVGHHMKSAELFPEYQGDPDNIQFLTRAEHFSAHNGNWQHPTNGYYDPETGIMTDFGSEKYVPCTVIELSDPVFIQTYNDTGGDEETSDNCDQAVVKQSCVECTVNPPSNRTSCSTKKRSVVSKRKPLHRIRSFANAHPVLTKSIISAVQIGVECLISAAIDQTFSSKQSSGHNSSPSSMHKSPRHTGDVSHKVTPISKAETRINDCAPIESSTNNMRSSPSLHTVSGYDRVVNGKTQHIESYVRGKPKE